MLNYKQLKILCDIIKCTKVYLLEYNKCLNVLNIVSLFLRLPTNVTGGLLSNCFLLVTRQRERGEGGGGLGNVEVTQFFSWKMKLYLCSSLVVRWKGALNFASKCKCRKPVSTFLMGRTLFKSTS